ncbi:hypothetical protein V2I01_41625 [Micromonospora sp. BRA006-A]|nr:hypothetical protein [Micromonospora sp. BRA006-A]
MTGAELAARAGIGAWHATEWLEQQAAAGVVEPAGDGPLPPAGGHRQALTDATSPFAVLSSRCCRWPGWRRCSTGWSRRTPRARAWVTTSTARSSAPRRRA